MSRLSKISPNQASELKSLIALASEERKKLSHVVQSKPSTVAASKLLNAFVEVLGDKDKAKHVVRQLIYFAEFSRLNRCSIKETLSDVASALSRNDGWQDDEVKKFSSITDWLAELTQSAAVYASAKALGLSYDTERSLVDFRVITDIRPVFDDERRAIIGATLLNVLQIEVSDSGDHQTLSIAASLEDLEKILAAAREAISKCKHTQQWLNSPQPIPSFIRGEEKYGFD